LSSRPALCVHWPLCCASTTLSGLLLGWEAAPEFEPRRRGHSPLLDDSQTSSPALRAGLLLCRPLAAVHICRFLARMPPTRRPGMVPRKALMSISLPRPLRTKIQPIRMRAISSNVSEVLAARPSVYDSVGCYDAFMDCILMVP